MNAYDCQEILLKVKVECGFALQNLNNPYKYFHDGINVFGDTSTFYETKLKKNVGRVSSVLGWKPACTLKQGHFLILAPSAGMGVNGCPSTETDSASDFSEFRR